MKTKLKATITQRGRLTRQEANTLRYLCEGYTRTEIAGFLFRSQSTVNRHMESIAAKLDAHSSAEIVSTAVALNMVKMEIRTDYAQSVKLIAILLMVNMTASHIDMTRSPRSPRPVRTARSSTRLTRSQRQYS